MAWVKSVHQAGIFFEYQVFHPGEGFFLPGLAEQDHQYDPLDLLDIDITRAQRHETIDNELSLSRRQDTDLLEIQDVPAAIRIKSRQFERVEQPNGTFRGLIRKRGEMSGTQTIEPVQGTVYFRFTESGL